MEDDLSDGCMTLIIKGQGHAEISRSFQFLVFFWQLVVIPTVTMATSYKLHVSSTMCVIAKFLGIPKTPYLYTLPWIQCVSHANNACSLTKKLTETASKTAQFHIFEDLTLPNNVLLLWDDTLSEASFVFVAWPWPFKVKVMQKSQGHWVFNVFLSCWCEFIILKWQPVSKYISVIKVVSLSIIPGHSEDTLFVYVAMETMHIQSQQQCMLTK